MNKQSDLDLQRQLDAAYKRKVENVLLLAVKRLTLEAFTRVVMRSPVDTGRFRSNWQVGVGTRPEGVVEIQVNPNHKKDANSVPIPASAEETNNALQQLAPLNARLDMTYVVNNLPYADALENGHSQQQAPQGMVAVTVDELRAAAGSIARLAAASV